MSKESNIDKLFRDNLKNAEHGFNPQSWEKMEAMLNAQPKAGFNYRLYGGIAAVLILLFSSTSVWYYQSANKGLKSNQLSEVRTNQNQLKADQEKPQIIKYSASFGLTQNALNEKQTKVTLAKANNVVSSESISEVNSSINNNVVVIESKQAKEANSVVSTQVELTDLASENGLSKTEIDYLIPNSFASESVDQMAIATNDPANFSKSLNNRHSFYANVANTFNHGFSNNSGLFGSNILNSIGLGYQFQITNNLALVSGINYKSKSANGYQYSVVNKQFGFGHNTTVTNVKLQSLQYVEIPLAVQYQLKGKHNFSAGATVAYLTNSKSIVSAEQSGSLSETETSTESQWGITNGLNKLDIGVMAAYDYNLTQKWQVGTLINLGVTDFSNDAVSGVTRKDVHQELQIRLTYKFLQF